MKKSKELDDNNPTKNDSKDPKVIAGLVREGRYMIPYLPDGVYAGLRTASNIRFQLQAEFTRIQNRISRWFNIYFPEYKTVYGKLDVECGKFASIEETLRQHNAQDRGIFFVVNFGGQDDEAITRINAQFVESDELSFEEQEKQICKSYRCKRGRVLLQWQWK